MKKIIISDFDDTLFIDGTISKKIEKAFINLDKVEIYL